MVLEAENFLVVLDLEPLKINSASGITRDLLELVALLEVSVVVVECRIIRVVVVHEAVELVTYIEWKLVDRGAQVGLPFIGEVADICGSSERLVLRKRSVSSFFYFQFR